MLATRGINTMPIYNYTCPKCATTIDIMKSVKDIDREEKCPVCNSVAKREVTFCNFIFKTLGFYTTDVKHGGSTARLKD